MGDLDFKIGDIVKIKRKAIVGKIIAINERHYADLKIIHITIPKKIKIGFNDEDLDFVFPEYVNLNNVRKLTKKEAVIWSI